MKCHNKHKSAGTLHSPQPSTNILFSNNTFCPLPTPQLPKPQTPKRPEIRLAPHHTPALAGSLVVSLIFSIPFVAPIDLRLCEKWVEGTAEALPRADAPGREVPNRRS